MSIDENMFCNNNGLTSIIVSILDLLSHSSFTHFRNNLTLPFESVTRLSIYDYVTVLLNLFKLHVSTVVLSLIYLDRISFKHRVGIKKNNYHKFFLISLTVASKYNEDRIFSNSHYSMAGGIKLSEFNALESRFLVLLEYSLFVGKEEFTNYLKFFKLYSTIKE